MKIKLLKPLVPTGLLLGTTLLLVGCGGSSSTAPVGTYDSSLKFDPSAYTPITVSVVDGTTTTSVKVRKYGPIKYVANPIKMANTQTSMGGRVTDMTADPYGMQEMYIYVPEASANDQKTGIWMMFNNGGWFFSVVQDAITDGATFTVNDSTPIAYALKAGYVIASVGTRSRGAVAADGITLAGKAPAAIVDAKAAIRYLKLNDSLIPGSSERIIIRGTSGGGGQVTAVGGSADSPDFYPYLAEIGAAGISGSGSAATSTLSDRVFAVHAYCPINNLAHADEGYEWQYNAVRGLTPLVTYDGTPNTPVTLTPAINGVAYAAGPQLAASATIAASFPTYVASLGLKLEDGTALTADKLPSLILADVAANIDEKLAAGTIALGDGSTTATVPPYGTGTFTATTGGMMGSPTHTLLVPNDFLTTSGSGTSARVANIDYTNYRKFVATLQALKTVVAFDAVGCNGITDTGSGESNLYGTSSQTYSNFSEWSWNNNAIAGDGSGLFDTGLTWNQYLGTSNGAALAKQLKMISPIPYLISSTSNPAPYWYVRHGMIDRDTTHAIQELLKYAVKNNGNVKDLNFKFPWMTGHRGDYDAKEAFTWIAAKLAANPL